MKFHKGLCVFFFSAITTSYGQYYGYPNYGQRPFPNVPTEVIDVPSGVEQRARIPMNTVPFEPFRATPNYGYYPYPYNYGGYYPSRQQPSAFQQPRFHQNNLQGKQLPKSLFRNPTPEFPNGYYVVPGSQRQVEVTPDDVKVPEVNTANKETTQEYPGYIIKQTSQRYQTPNQNPVKITTNTVEYKPFHTVLTRYIDRNGKPVIKLQNENGTMTLDGKGSTSLSINNGKLQINGVDPAKVTTTEEPEITTENDVTPKDISSWIG